ncbi:conserved hypothetical protein [Sporisorium reilianum SRZ2]|uniref:Uncharacterized protein n=1 Tax=Sporisorium reilianum (strain SRZ2) TaxID=999809 RepID=E6ZSM5_SPORE|nr:conserved hypothetical protein [Sporisorium reilianum SRZ2]
MGNTKSALNRDPPKVHQDLCGLRYDNRYGFASTSFRGITTTCFNDVVLEPLATWVLLLVLLPLLALAVKRKRSSTNAASRLIHYRSNAYRNESKLSGRHAGLRTGLDVLYMLLVVAALLMNILQIVRLALAHRGVGLLPFNIAGILIVLVLMHVRTPAASAVSLTILLFWTMLLAFTSVALAGMGKLNGIEDRKGTEYLLSDEMIDVGVQVGLYAVFWIVEAARLAKSLLATRKGLEGSARLPEHPVQHDALAMSPSAENKEAVNAA